ncbi:MAG: BA14K family protein, partial [Hyphomicrobium sp.]|nr:BA14K family protein [Hyphomicrobium sp.]
GAYGMAAAARNYFNKDLQALTLSEAAMLAGLIQAPSRFNPMTNPEAAQQRAAVVLDAMVDAKAIGPAQAAAAKATPAIVRSSPRTVPAETWFADWIAQHEFAKVAGTTSRPMRVRTTLDRRVQAVAERVVNNALDRSGASLGVSQAALVALRPNGAVVAMVGGRDYKDSQFNRAVDARRQPGSAFKLFVFYAALRNGYSINDVIDASPIEIKSWRPENYGGQRYGRLSLEDAFAYSVNTAAIRLALDVGLDNVVAAARELGLTAPLAEVPSMALGTNEVSLLDLTGAFASIRAGRARLEPWGIAAFGPEGSGLRQLSPPVGITQELTHQQEMNELLERVVTSGTGRGAALSDGSAAGKTGTSQDYRDAWFIGYSRDLVVGVWVGNDDRTPMHRVTGGSLPATIWRDFMTAATPILGQPDDAVADAVAAPSDGPATPACDVKACSTAYSSFRSSDCTYQPYSGPRRLCEWRFDPSSSIPRIARAAAASGSCDADACGRRFRSFDSATCTYQPYGGGPRAICDIKAAE